MSFKPFNFNPELLNAIEQAKFTKASKIQQLVIPEILKGNDIIASAHSGSGKSASFILPLIQKLLDNPRDTSSNTVQHDDESDTEIEESACKHGPRVLILTPTRELANQVSACIRRFTREFNLRYGILVGGAPYPPQVRMLKKPIDFLVATPGRLLDHVNNGRVNFNDVEYLIIDEVNRILDMNMENDIEFVINQIPRKEGKALQTLMFSDTLEGERIKAFSEKYQNNAVSFELAKSKQNYRSLQQCMYIADEGDHKFKLLQAIISGSESKHIIVYSAFSEQLELARQFLASHVENVSNENNVLKLQNSAQEIFFASDNFSNDNLSNNNSEQQQDLPAASDVQIIHLDLPDDILVFLQRLEIVIKQQSTQELCLLVGKDEWSMLHQVERYLGKTLSRKKITGLEPESSEPSISSKLSGTPKNNNQTKNRNPYSGRRQNSNQNPNQKNRHSKNNNASNNNGNDPAKTQGQGSPQGSNKNRNNRNNKNRNSKPNRNNQQPLDNGNQIFSDTYSDDRDLSWKQYISNISSGNGNPKNANKKFRRKGVQSSGFDLNNSPMAISAKSMRDMNNKDEWIGEESTNKKPDVQIRVKGQNKSVGSDQTRNENDFDKDRIEGKLGIHNK